MGLIHGVYDAKPEGFVPVGRVCTTACPRMGPISRRLIGIVRRVETRLSGQDLGLHV